MTNSDGELQALASRWAILVYKIVQVAHDFAYFGFITVQPLIVNEILVQQDSLTPATSLGWTIAIISLHLLFQFFLETPSGAYADNKGRMVTVRDSFLVRAAAMASLAGAFYLSLVETSWLPVLFLLVLVQLLMAVAEALFTGSIEAWLVDTLKHCDKEGEVGEAFSSSAVHQNSAILVAMPLFLFLYFSVGEPGSGTRVYFILAAIGFLFAAAGFLAHKTRREIYRQGTAWKQREVVSVRTTLTQCFSLIRSSPPVLWSMLLIASPLGAWVIVSWMWPILQKAAFLQKGSGYEGVEFILTSFGLVMGISRVGGAWLCQAIQGFMNPFFGLRLALFLNLGTLSVGSLFILFYPESGALAVKSEESSGLFQSIPLGAAVFAAALVIAKALEELVKIFSQIVLARIIIDSTVRATAISFAALLSNLLAFVFISIGVALSLLWTDDTGQAASVSRVGTIVSFVAIAGLLSALFSSGRLSASISGSSEESLVESDDSEDLSRE